MVVSTDKLRRNLDGAAIEAEVTQTALRNVLQNFLYDRFKATQSGHKLQGVSANGQSTTIASDNSDVMFEVWSILLNLFDTCKTSLTSAGDGTTDAAVLTEMKYRLDSEAVLTVRHDFSLIRQSSSSF